MIKNWYTAVNGGHNCCCFGGHLCGALICPSNDCRGGQMGGVQIEQIYDGTSTTLLCEEMAGKPDVWIKGVKQSGNSPISGFPPGQNPGGAWGSWSATAHWFVGSDFTGKATFKNASNIPTCFFNCTNEDNINAVYSFHPGAGGVVMCDGSAHMLSENISVIVFMRMISIKGKQPVTDAF
jgi:hypothetical protein